MEAALRAEAESIKADDFEFRRGLANAQIDKILLCEKYNNAESCNAFFDALSPEQKYLVRNSRFRKDKWLLRYDAFERWGKQLTKEEQYIKDYLAAERANRAAIAQAIGAWGISNQLMIMNNTLNSMQGIMMFNRPLR